MNVVVPAVNFHRGENTIKCLNHVCNWFIEQLSACGEAVCCAGHAKTESDSLDGVEAKGYNQTRGLVYNHALMSLRTGGVFGIPEHPLTSMSPNSE